MDSNESFGEGVAESGDSRPIFGVVDPAVVGKIEKKLPVLPYVVEDRQNLVGRIGEFSCLGYAVLVPSAFTPGFTGADGGFISSSVVHSKNLAI